MFDPRFKPKDTYEEDREECHDSPSEVLFGQNIRLKRVGLYGV